MDTGKLALERSESSRYTAGEFELNVGRYIFAARYVEPSYSILDVACGTGYGVKILAPRSKVCVGVDNSPEALKQSETLCEGTGASFVQADCCNLPFPEKNFDLIVSMETIEHLKEPRTFLKELVRTAKPGARIIISTPNRQYKVPWVRGINPYHIYEWSPEEFRELAEEYFNDFDIYFQWPSVPQRIIDNLALTIRKTLFILPENMQSKILSLLRTLKLMIFRPSPKIQEINTIETSDKYEYKLSAGSNLSGIRRPQSMILVAFNNNPNQRK